MAANRKRVFWVDYISPRFAETLAEREDVQLDRLSRDAPADVATSILSSAHAYQIISARDEITPAYFGNAALLARMPNLLVVSTNGAGYDTVDLAACTEAGVLAVNQAGGNREAVAEHALGMLLALTKRIVETDRHLRRAAGIDRNAYMGHDALGRTVGIVGIGHVGSRFAELCRGLFAMRVLAYDPYLSADEIRARGAEKVELETIMRESDYVSVHCPLTAETRGMIGVRELALMKSHAYFITTARGHIHDEAALLEALREKRIAGAGLDVWAKEPPPPDHPLLQLDNVIASAHNAGVTYEARVTIGRIAAEQLLAVFDGKRPPRLLNPEVWPAYARRFERLFGWTPG
jgi:D-3-phosphoglycerate dehydrogenase